MKFKAYKHNDVDPSEAVKIRGKYYYLQQNEGEAKENLGEFSVYSLGWGSDYHRYEEFSPEEQELLRTTLK